MEEGDARGGEPQRWRSDDASRGGVTAVDVHGGIVVAGDAHAVEKWRNKFFFLAWLGWFVSDENKSDS